MSSEKISSSTKLIVTPDNKCGFHCQHCHVGREDSLYPSLTTLTPEHIKQIAAILKTAKIDIEIVKVAGLAGDCFFSKKIDLAQLVNSLIDLLSDKERSLDKNSYPRIHLITNALFITREALETLKLVLPYIGITLSIDTYHHHGSKHLHKCSETASEKIYQAKHLSSCPYFDLLAEKVKLISEFTDPNRIFVNMSEEPAQAVNIDTNFLAIILGIPSENIFINTPINPKETAIRESTPSKAYNTNSLFVISTPEGLTFYASYYDLLINHPHAALQNLLQNHS